MLCAQPVYHCMALHAEVGSWGSILVEYQEQANVPLFLIIRLRRTVRRSGERHTSLSCADGMQRSAHRAYKVRFCQESVTKHKNNMKTNELTLLCSGAHTQHTMSYIVETGLFKAVRGETTNSQASAVRASAPPHRESRTDRLRSGFRWDGSFPHGAAKSRSRRSNSEGVDQGLRKQTTD
jgi:hypothetical protein